MTVKTSNVIFSILYGLVIYKMIQMNWYFRNLVVDEVIESNKSFYTYHESCLVWELGSFKVLEVSSYKTT